MSAASDLTLTQVLHSLGLVVHRVDDHARGVSLPDGEVLHVGTAGSTWHWLRATGRYDAPLACAGRYCHDCVEHGLRAVDETGPTHAELDAIGATVGRREGSGDDGLETDAELRARLRP